MKGHWKWLERSPTSAHPEHVEVLLGITLEHRNVRQFCLQCFEDFMSCCFQKALQPLKTKVHVNLAIGMPLTSKHQKTPSVVWVGHLHLHSQGLGGTSFTLPVSLLQSTRPPHGSNWLRNWFPGAQPSLLRTRSAGDSTQRSTSSRYIQPLMSLDRIFPHLWTAQTQAVDWQ